MQLRTESEYSHVLILDDMGTPSVDSKISTFSKFLNENDKVKLMIISSVGCITEEDKQKSLAWLELDPYPTRAAHLRELLGIEKDGLHSGDALCFRDKYVMKKIAHEGGFPCPKFKKIMTPSDIVAFTNCNGYPAIIKPSMGCASAGVHVLHCKEERDFYLKNEFYKALDELNGQLDHSGDLIIEKFVKGTMYHVNGFAKDGVIQYCWPFKYFNNNLDFTMGKTYGNLLISRSNYKWNILFDNAQKLLNVLPKSKNLFFHLELFDEDQEVGAYSCGEEKQMNLLMCEIAARKPGGSIGNLIDNFQIENNENWTSFIEFVFRVSIGLEPNQKITSLCDPQAKFDSFSVTPSIADLMIPLQKGRLTNIPFQETCPVKNVQYIPISKVGTCYQGYNINKVNTSSRFVCRLKSDLKNNFNDETESEMVLRLACKWFELEVKYSLSTANIEFDAETANGDVIDMKKFDVDNKIANVFNEKFGLNHQILKLEANQKN
ncbi:hypothetical protein HDU92_001149 [Lobulomyces angularis]|nr:hypothetical protein HDU92_001149 [Lobulomyces angularis]